MTRMPKAKSAAIATLGGVDIGKSTFHLIGLDKRGAIVLRERLSRAQIEEGRMRGGQLVPNKSREFLVQKGQGRLRPRRCSIAVEMPKSAFSANSQAKMVAARYPSRARQEGEVSGTLPEHLLVPAGPMTT